jgi:hypothetical protein
MRRRAQTGLRRTAEIADPAVRWRDDMQTGCCYRTGHHAKWAFRKMVARDKKLLICMPLR